jgi:hypothetical protein
MDEMMQTHPDVAPASAPAPARPSAFRHLLVALAAVFAVGAIAVVVVGLGARSDADDAEQRAQQLARVERTHEQARDDDDADREEVAELADAVTTHAEAVADAFTTAENAQVRFTDMTNRGADVFNNGDVGGSEAIYRDEGGPLLEELRTTQAAVNAAMATLHSARDELEEALR